MSTRLTQTDRARIVVADLFSLPDVYKATFDTQLANYIQRLQDEHSAYSPSNKAVIEAEAKAEAANWVFGKDSIAVRAVLGTFPDTCDTVAAIKAIGRRCESYRPAEVIRKYSDQADIVYGAALFGELDADGGALIQQASILFRWVLNGGRKPQ